MRPPQHAIDAPARYVLATDPAWNWDEVDREIEGSDTMPEIGDHPIFTEYLAGETRYDTGAPMSNGRTPAEYMTGAPTVYLLERLDPLDVARIKDIIDRDSASEALYSAFRRGVADIEGPISYDRRGGEVTRATMRAVYDSAGGLGGITAIGMAVWRLSAPLSEAEKKT